MSDSVLLEEHRKLFGKKRPVIGCLHMMALPGTPYYDPSVTMEQHINRLIADAKALQKAGFDALVFANEGDRPYLTQVGPEIIASYVRIASGVLPEIKVPYGCGVLIDPRATIAVAKAIGAKFVRTYVSNSYTGTFGYQDFNPAEVFRYRAAIHAEEVHVYTYFEPHAGTALDSRPVAEQIGSGFAALPIAGMLIGGPRAGLPPEEAHFRKIKETFPQYPLILGSGSNKKNIKDLLPYADGVIVGTSIKKDGYLYNPVDPKRAKEFMEAARKVQ